MIELLTNSLVLKKHIKLQNILLALILISASTIILILQLDNLINISFGVVITTLVLSVLVSLFLILFSFPKLIFIIFKQQCLKILNESRTKQNEIYSKISEKHMEDQTISKFLIEHKYLGFYDYSRADLTSFASMTIHFLESAYIPEKEEIDLFNDFMHYRKLIWFIWKLEKFLRPKNKTLKEIKWFKIKKK
uniref:Uncharacterized protein n=1 Tax=Mycoplasma anserisalpingitidis TaxID=519450 RepID=A0A8F2IHZ1_9MOLU|nr:hypothetical protein [Mycoplasma anserisalpingitidis]